MKSIIKFAACIFLSGMLIFISCKKELSCEGCEGGNKPPTANAGADQTITLPKDSVMLDGSASIDPDGTITSYKWTKIAGPVSSNIVKPDSLKTLVKTLVAGVYKFELTVTNNGGLSAKDTVQVMVDAPGNQPPVACAGADQMITLPINIVNLNGSCSADPDNNITGYVWTKVSGPSSFNIGNGNAVQTQITNLVQGVYLFELKVTDASGLFSKDTMSISVNGPCNNKNWPIKNATLDMIGNLSEPRTPGVGAAGNKVVFAGGWKQASSCCFSCGEFTVGSSVVDIYDVKTSSWQTHQLSKARLIGSSINVGDKIFFAGGTSWVFHPGVGEWDVSYDNVDIYNVSTNTWEVAHLSKARERIAVGAIGNKVFFAGGSFYTGNPLSSQVWAVSNVVDIYDLSTNSWSASTLSVARAGINSVVIGDKIYFVGGYGYGSATNYSNIVDIYNSSTNTWSTTDLQTVVASLSPPPGMGVIDKFYSVGNNIIFWDNQNQVGIRSLATGLTSTACISYKPAYLVNNKIVFFNGTNEMDIYDEVTGIWSTGVSNPAIPAGDYSVIQLNNSLYLAGGWSGTNGGECVFSNKVYRLSW